MQTMEDEMMEDAERQDCNFLIYQAALFFYMEAGSDTDLEKSYLRRWKSLTDARVLSKGRLQRRCNFPAKIKSDPYSGKKRLSRNASKTSLGSLGSLEGFKMGGGSKRGK
jgi:hypothetical protein